ncbi:sigma factor-like helix-turn-helix DNA-binding protein [Clostridium sp. YIM B02555]|uniref:sigma factor-like helix-turn-helix DNA-binding protein n=1 Tax=Clostridium sp. YIM B02555 TaxID=2911968 RepID=UPI001EEEB889
MDKSIYETIIEYQKNYNNEYVDNIIGIFSNQINKYARLLDGDDTKQTLLIFLIEVIRKLNMNNEYLKNEKVLLSYISKSLRHKYIKLSKEKNILNLETELNYDIEIKSNESLTDLTIYSDILTELNYKEREIIKLIYIYGYSAKEIAEFKHKSRQAINQTKKRALNKIKECYFI